MSKYLVIGLGAFGKTLALKLMEKKDAEIVAIDSKMDLIEEIQNDVTYAMCLDSTDEKALKSIGLNEFDVGIVCFGEDFESTIMTSVLLKNNGVKRVITRSSNPIHLRILKAIGIDEIITPEIEVAEKLAYNIMFNNLFDIIHYDEKLTVVKITAPKDFIGKTIGELNLRAKFGINVISVERLSSAAAGNDESNKNGNGKDKKREHIINNNPGAETPIMENDILMVVGDQKNLKKFTKSM